MRISGKRAEEIRDYGVPNLDATMRDLAADLVDAREELERLQAILSAARKVKQRAHFGGCNCSLCSAIANYDDAVKGKDTTCSQCGGLITDSACGPTHALLAHEAVKGESDV